MDDDFWRSTDEIKNTGDQKSLTLPSLRSRKRPRRESADAQGPFERPSKRPRLGVNHTGGRPLGRLFSGARPLERGDTADWSFLRSLDAAGLLPPEQRPLQFSSDSPPIAQAFALRPEDLIPSRFPAPALLDASDCDLPLSFSSKAPIDRSSSDSERSSVSSSTSDDGTSFDAPSFDAPFGGSFHFSSVDSEDSDSDQDDFLESDAFARTFMHARVEKSGPDVIDDSGIRVGKRYQAVLPACRTQDELAYEIMKYRQRQDGFAREAAPGYRSLPELMFDPSRIKSETLDSYTASCAAYLRRSSRNTVPCTFIDDCLTVLRLFNYDAPVALTFVRMNWISILQRKCLAQTQFRRDRAPDFDAIDPYSLRSYRRRRRRTLSRKKRLDSVKRELSAVESRLVGPPVPPLATSRRPRSDYDDFGGRGRDSGSFDDDGLDAVSVGTRLQRESARLLDEESDDDQCFPWEEDARCRPPRRLFSSLVDGEELSEDSEVSDHDHEKKKKKKKIEQQQQQQSDDERGRPPSAIAAAARGLSRGSADSAVGASAIGSESGGLGMQSEKTVVEKQQVPMEMEMEDRNRNLTLTLTLTPRRRRRRTVSSPSKRRTTGAKTLGTPRFRRNSNVVKVEGETESETQDGREALLPRLIQVTSDGAGAGVGGGSVGVGGGSFARPRGKQLHFAQGRGKYHHQVPGRRRRPQPYDISEYQKVRSQRVNSMMEQIVADGVEMLSHLSQGPVPNE